MRTAELFAFIQERYMIYKRKEDGHAKPWTQDPILQNYKFCNVHRENDAVTKWIATNWRDKNPRDPNIWMAMAIARYINWPPTLAELKYPNWKTPRGNIAWKDDLYCVLHNRRDREEKIFSSAYMITTHGHKVDKFTYIVDAVLMTLWDSRRELDAKNFHTLHDYHKALSSHEGVGSFMAAQIIADVKYTPQWLLTSDWETFAASGPGSRRGLNRVMAFPATQTWKEEFWKGCLLDLKSKIDPLVKKAGIPPIHAQDLQNCLCEFDKYERIRLGEGQMKSRYPGTATTSGGNQ
jgi:hypothetical protein